MSDISIRQCIQTLFVTVTGRYFLGPKNCLCNRIFTLIGVAVNDRDCINYIIVLKPTSIVFFVPSILQSTTHCRFPVEANAFGKTEKKSMPDAAPRHFNQPGGGVPVADGGAKKTEDIIQVRCSLKKPKRSSKKSLIA